jgi:hypothetical protein
LHAHLSAEKAIKAALINEDDLELLNPWAVQGRYPADLGDITTDRVTAVVAAAARVVTSITSQLT